jgi:predicted histidine transporter YuiF (NhaC family)
VLVLFLQALLRRLAATRCVVTNLLLTFGLICASTAVPAGFSEEFMTLAAAEGLKDRSLDGIQSKGPEASCKALFVTDVLPTFCLSVLLMLSLQAFLRSL